MTKFTETPQWKSGSNVADFLDAYFSAQGWQITPTSRHEERDLCLGDRHFRRADKHLLIEYKSGLQTAQTGNVFLETVSVDSQNLAGWVFTCQADWILYAALGNDKLLFFRPANLRNGIVWLQATFPTKKTGKRQNANYDTHGVIVPLAYAEQHLASKVVVLSREQPR